MALNDDFIVKNGLVVRAASSTYQSTSTTTGAIVTPGGLGIGQNATIGGQLNVLSTSSFAGNLQVGSVTKVLSTAINTATVVPDGNALQVAGGIYAANINISGIGLIKGSQILTQADGFKGGVISQPLIINTNTQSTSTSSGALTTPGGIGFGGNLNVGGSAWVTGTVYLSSDIYYQTQHLLANITTSPGPGIVSKVIFNGYTATIITTNTGVLTVTGGTGINVDNPNGNITVSNIGVTSIQAGTDITVDFNTGTVTVSDASTLQSVLTRGNGTDQQVFLNNTAIGTDLYTTNVLNVLGSIGANMLNVASTSYIGGAIVVTTSNINRYVGGIITNTLRIQNTTSSVSTQTGALVVDGGVGIGQDVNIGGSLFIQGGITVLGSYTTVTVNSTQTVFTDPVIDLGSGYNNRPLAINDGLDRGLLLHYNTGSNTTYDTHAFIGRQASSGQLVFLTDILPGGNEVVPNPYTGNPGTMKLGQMVLVSPTASTSTNSGALTVVGGVGIQGGLNVGGSAYLGNVYDNGNRVVTNVNLTSTLVTVSSAGSGIAVQSTVVTGSFVTVNLTNTGIVGLFGASGISVSGFTATNGMLTGVSTITNTGVLTVQGTGDIGVTYIAPLGQSYGSGNVTVVNNSTLQTVTDRGFTTTNQINITNTATSMIVTGTTVTIQPGPGNYALNVAGGITATTLYVAQAGFINNAQIITSATINSFSGGTINNSLYIASTQTSTSSTTGALRVAGGVGFQSSLNVGGTITAFNTGTAINAYGNAYFSSTIYVNTVSALVNNLYLTTGTGTGTVYANGIDLLNRANNARYVSATSGSDSNDGLRPISPYATIAKALSVATAGTTIYLAQGTYTETWPLLIPAGVTLQGAGLRSTIIQPTTATNTLTGILLNGETLVSDVSLANYYQPGYGMAFATGAKITSKSPYVERVSFITKGTVQTATDPFGYASANAGNGIYLDASVLSPASLEPAMLFNEVTFVTPNATGIYMTNGVRAELLNGFVYFANTAINAQAGATGIGGSGQTRLKISGASGSFVSGDVLNYKDPAGNTLAQGTITTASNGYVYMTGPVWGFATVTDRTPKTVTPIGTSKQSTTQKKFGASSAYFDGSSGYLQVLSDIDLQFGVGGFTFESWIWLNSSGVTNTIFNKGTASTQQVMLQVNSTGHLSGYWGIANAVGTTALSTGTWYHVAMTRDPSLNRVAVYVNGVIDGFTVGAVANVNTIDSLNIGADALSTNWFNGYMDDIRVSNVSRYGSSYTVPTAAQTSDIATVLMLHVDGGNNSTSYVDDGVATQTVFSTGTSPQTATRITLADYHQFGAELRCIGSAAVYGNKGVVANGTGTDLKLIAFNMSFIGAGGDITNDTTLVVQANEVTQTKGGLVYYQTVDQAGNFRVGNSFLVNEQTGAVSFGNANVNLSSVNELIITDGTNNATILPTSITVGNLSLAGGTLGSLTGNITLSPDSGNSVIINSPAQVNGSLTISGSFAVPSVQASTSTATGALTVAGGVGIAGAVYAGSTLTSYASAISTSSILNNAIVAPNGGIGAQTLYLTQSGYIGGYAIVTTASIGASLGGIVPNALHITATNQSTSTTTGALIVDGGVGVGGNLTVGGNLNLLGGGSVLTNVSATTDSYIGASVTKTGTTATINIVNLGVQSLTAGPDITVSSNTGTVTVNNISTLDTVVARGSATSQIITMSNVGYSTSTIAGNALQVTGGIGAAHLYLSTDGWINGAQIVTSSTIGSFVGGQAVTSPLQITSTATYALQVGGGALIGGNTVIQGSLQVAGTVTSINSTSVDIGNKVIFLSTLSGAPIQTAGAGIVVGKDDGIENDRWASLLFDGGAGPAGNWVVKAGLNPFTDSYYGIGSVSLQWNSAYIKTINASSVLTTSSAYSTSSVAGNALQVTGGIGARSIYLTTDGYIGGFPIVTSGNISTYAGTYDGATPIHNPLQVVNTSSSTSVTTGALQVSGGTGILLDLWVGGSGHFAKNIYVTNTATIQSTSLALSPTTGALQVSGGVGVLGNIWVGSTVNVNDSITVSNNATVGGNLNLTTGVINLNNTITNYVNALNTLTVSNSAGAININPFTQLNINGALVQTGATTHNGTVAISNANVTTNTQTGALQVIGGIATGDSLYAGNNITATNYITANGNFISSSSIAGNAITAPVGGLGARSLYLSDQGYINGAVIVTTATINQYSGGTIGNTLNLSNTTNSLSTQTGALTVAGGVGIGKDVNIGGSLYLQGDLFVDGNQTLVNSTSIQTGDKIIYVSTAAASAILASGSGIAVGKPGAIRASLLFDGVSSWSSSASINPSGTGTGLGTYSNAWSYGYFNTIKLVGNTTSTNTLTGSLQVLGGISATENLYLGTNRTSTLTNTYNALTTVGGAYIGGQLTINGPDAWLAGSPILTANNSYQVNFQNTTDATNTQTAAVTVAGGLGVGSTLIVGGQQYITSLLESTVTNTQNALVVSGGIYSDMLMVNQIATVNGGVVITTATIGNFSFNGGTINKPIIINSATQATSTITGALQVTNGGAGIGGNVYIGGTLNVTANSSTFKTITAGTATITTGTVSSAIFNTATQAGNALQVVGGIYAGYLNVKNQAWINGSPVITAATINSFSGGTINNPLAINDATQATSTTTGALKVINGGLGVGGNIWSGGYFEFVDPFTASYDGYFGINTGLNAVNIGSNNTNLPLAIVQNKNEIARYTVYNAVGGAQGAVLGVGNTNPQYGIHLNASSAGTWNWIQTANTMTNLMSLNNTLENALGIGSSDISKLAFASFNPNGDGTTFEHWIASGQQNAGTASALVFAGGAWDNNLNTNTTVEWARFLANGTFSAKGNLVTTAIGASTATIGTNALQVSGGAWVGSLNVTGAAWVGNSKVITAATIASYNFNGGTITTPLYVNTTTQAVNNSSGAIRTSGGISAVGNIYAGLNFYGNLVATNVTATNINVPGNPLTIGGTVTISTGTDQTGAGTGALQVTGGAAITQSLYVGSTFLSTSTIAGNAIQVPNGGIGAQNLYLSGNGFIGNAQIVTSANINSFSGGTINNALTIANPTQSVSTTTGAIVITNGGLGLGGNIWVGGNANVLGSLYLTGDLYVDGTQTFVNSTNIQTGDKVLYLSTTSGNAALAINSGIAIGNTVSPFASLLFDGINSWVSQGNINPSTSGGWSLGSSTLPWNTLYGITGRFSGVVDSTTTQTGSLQVIGGAGIGKSLTVGNTATVQSTLYNLTSATGNAIYTPGGIGAKYLTIDTNAYVNGSAVITVANIGGYAYNGGYVNNAIIVNSTTNATAALNTGSIVTYGGVAITKDTYVGGTINVASTLSNTGTIAGNAVTVTGGIGANTLYIATAGYIGTSPIITAANINSFSGGTINAALTINNGTQAVSTTTGALIVQNGGVGIGGNLYTGGYAAIGQAYNTPGTLGNTASGSLQVLGGAGIAGNLTVASQGYFGGNVGINTALPNQALEVNGNIVAGAYNYSRVQITNAGGSQAIYEIATTETTPRWQIGRDLLGIGTSGIAFMNANQTFGTGGAAIGAVSGLNGAIGFYSTNGTSMTLRGIIDSGASGGNLGIGATSNLQGKLHLSGSASSGYGLYATGGNIDHVFRSGNAGQYVDLQVTRTGGGAQSDWRVGIAGAASNFIATAAQGDAVMSYSTNMIIASQSNYEMARFGNGTFTISTATPAISTQSGSIVTYGGVGIGGDLFVAATANITGTTVISQTIASTSSIAGNALQVKGGIGAQSIYLTNASWINGYQIVTTQNIGAFSGAFNGGTITAPLFIANTTDSGSTSSGALYTTGGVGISRQLYVGGITTLANTLNVTGQTNLLVATQSNSTLTGSLVITNGGIGLGGNIYLGGNQNFSTNVSKIRWQTVQIAVNDDAGAGNGSIFFNGGNSGFPATTSSIGTVVIGAWAGPTVSGANNTLVGNSAGYSLTGGTGNTIFGQGAGYYIAAGTNNTIVGLGAGGGNSTTLSSSVAIGYQALSQSIGTQNVAVGYQAGKAITSGAYNVLIGGIDGSTIATSSNNILLSDGQGNLRAGWNSGGVLTHPGAIVITNITSATSTATGALTIAGGLGVAGDIYARNIYANGALVGTGGGGGGGGGSSTSTPYINVYTATAAISTLTGGLTTVGGAGIGKDLFVGGPVVIGNSSVFINSGANLQAQGNIISGSASIANGIYAQGGNSVLYSSDYSQANWTKLNSSYQAGSTYSPDGTLNATKLVETSATGNHYFQQVISQSGPVTVSVFMQAADRTYGAINLTVAGVAHTAWYNLTTGVVSNTAAGLYPVTGRIELVPYVGTGNWYRCSLTVNAPGSATATLVGIYTAIGSGTVINDSLTSYTGTAGFGIYIYGAQVEPGYIPGYYTATSGSALPSTSNNIYTGGSLFVATTATVAGSTVTTYANLMQQFGGTTNNSLTIASGVNSTSTTSGALIITNGGIGVGGNVYIGGTLYATAKSFLIDHPTKKGYKLQYGSLEGPENGVYVRGRCTGNIIELPDYWTALVDADSITVDITPIGSHQKLYVDRIENNKIYIGNENIMNKKINCFYTVWAERKDVGKLDVEGEL